MNDSYYPFGMEMPARTFSSPLYRYGFNGKERDDEAKGSGEQYDYGFRIYDPRVGRFLSVDPLTKSFPQLTPYQYSSNRPIDGIDLDGSEYITFHVKITRDAEGNPVFTKKIFQDFRGMTAEQMALVHNKPQFAEDFYKNYSESFGPEGRGFKWVYYENDKQIGEPVWQMRQSKSLYLNGGNSGYYSGAGSITKFGPGLSSGLYSELNNDYDFSYAPMSYSDFISKRHDMMQEKNIVEPQGWLEDVRTLLSDRILIRDAKQGLSFFTPLTNSKEDKIRTTNIVTFFSAVIKYKEWKIKEMKSKNLDIAKAEDQLKVIFNDWKPTFLSSDWFAKQLLRVSGGGANEDKRGTTKPIAKKHP